jgi:hypothetical protein
VGLSAGKSLLGGLMLGALLALVLGCGAAVFYFSRLMADPARAFMPRPIPASTAP